MSNNRKALCIGVNIFKNFPSAILQGCVKDAHDMAALFKDLLGFTDPDITILTDSQATKANIMRSLHSMVKDAKAGKCTYLIFSLSTYGTLVQNASGDEPDNTDDAFCPHDLAIVGSQWDSNHIILGDELHELFVQLPRNVLLEVFLDTCHSGTGLKTIDPLLDRKPRYLPPPSLIQFMSISDGRRSRGLSRSILDKGLAQHIRWAGCRADQTAVDALIGGVWNGAYTYYFCKEMRACNNKLSRVELLKKVTANLKKGRYSQIPQLEGEAKLRRSPIT
jgi:metacaspase-1